ncbi:MAG: hypothetical protein AAGF36_08475 [Pseudomonadota bacterium]
MLALCVLSLGTPAKAHDLIAAYHAVLADVDLLNSSGAPLVHFCDVLQQDRVNVHRFGRAHELDDGDPLFGDAELRALIAPMCRAAGGFPVLADGLRRFGSKYVYVQIYGHERQMSDIVVSEGAG